MLNDLDKISRIFFPDKFLSIVPGLACPRLKEAGQTNTIREPKPRQTTTELDTTDKRTTQAQHGKDRYEATTSYGKEDHATKYKVRHNSIDHRTNSKRPTERTSTTIVKTAASPHHVHRRSI